MVAWLEHAECQLQTVDQVFFAVIVCPVFVNTPPDFEKLVGGGVSQRDNINITDIIQVATNLINH